MMGYIENFTLSFWLNYIFVDGSATVLEDKYTHWSETKNQLKQLQDGMVDTTIDCFRRKMLFRQEEMANYLA